MKLQVQKEKVPRENAPVMIPYDTLIKDVARWKHVDLVPESSWDWNESLNWQSLHYFQVLQVLFQLHLARPMDQNKSLNKLHHIEVFQE